MFGIYDPENKVWLGNDKGPILYDDETLAQCAATILTTRNKILIVAKEYDYKPKVLKDVITPDMSAEEAIKRIEEGGL